MVLESGLIWGGGKGAMPPKVPKVALFALHMQCIINMCSDLYSIYAF